MNTSASSIKAWISGTKSGNITPNNAALAAGVLDMTEPLEGFSLRPEDDRHVTKRLLDAFLTKKQVQALART